MRITAEMINDILKRIRDYCKNNDYCGACPFLSLDEETSAGLPLISFCDLVNLDPQHSLPPYLWPAEDWLLDDEDVDSEDESEEEDDTILPW